MGQGTWTDGQWMAINTKGCDLLVAAAAGSGKTAVLVERIIREISEGEYPREINRLLVVTFTKAAASEMNQRIGSALVKKLEKEPNNVHLQNQMAFLPRADIKTIHAFCLQVIKENYHLLQLDPALRTADQGEIKLLKQEVLSDLMEEAYGKVDNTDFFQLVEYFSQGTGDKPLRELILDIHNFMQGSPKPLSWLKEAGEVLDFSEESFDDLHWIRLIKRRIKMEMIGLIEESKQLMELCNSDMEFQEYGKMVEKEYFQMLHFYESINLSYEEIALASRGVSYGRLPSYRGTEKEFAEIIKGRRAAIKKGVNSIRERYFPYQVETMKEHLSCLYPIVKVLLQVVEQFSERFQEAKKEKMILDFNDYEHYCLEILLDRVEDGSFVPSVAAEMYQEKYDEVFIDEYQDSNMVQELILWAVSGENKGKPNRFMVGDVKQSIYRFRLAMPEIFMEKYRSYPVTEGGNQQKVILSTNFRSRENVLKGVNYIFRQIMTEGLGGLPYDEEAALSPGAVFPPCDGLCGGENEILLMERQDRDGEEDETIAALQELSNRALEAMMIAKRIHQLKAEKFQVIDKKTGTYRPVMFRDIVILLRSVSAWKGVFEEIFLKEEIPFYAESAMGYFDTLEVMTIENLLTILDNPRQDIPLIAVLYSPIFGFNADELLEIRLNQKSNDFFSSMKSYVGNEKDQSYSASVLEKLEDFFEKLERWRNEARHLSMSELLWYLYEETGYFDYVGVTAGGGLRQSNLQLLVERGQQFEKTSLKGLFQFVHYIQSLKKMEEDMNPAKLTNENENLIRIMTIHKSKGLEFPVVFVSDLGKQFNQNDTKKEVLYHKNYGLGFDYIDLENRVKYKSLAKVALSNQIREENLAEEIRVLYVSMTRAKEKLILTGSIKGIEKNIENWLQVARSQGTEISVYSLLKAKSYLDWIMPSMLSHEAGKRLVLEVMDMKVAVDKTIREGGDWNISIVTKAEVWVDQLEKKKNILSVSNEIKSLIEKEGEWQEDNPVAMKLNWRYPNEKAITLPSKISISEIKRKHMEAEGVPMIEIFYQEEKERKIPIFLTEKQKLTSGEKGTVIHDFMEYIDLRKDYTIEVIQKKLEDCVAENRLTKEEADCISLKKILSFFTSSLAKRLQKSDKIEKERAFAMTLLPQEIYPEKEQLGMYEPILINGMIDCYFYEGKEIVLLDYKTDNIQEGQEDILKQRYGIQLQLYKRALERSTGLRVKEMYLYSFSLGKEIQIL